MNNQEFSLRGVVLVVIGMVAGIELLSAQSINGSYEAWQKHRDAVVVDKSLVRYYTFEDIHSPGANIPNQAGSKVAPLIFRVDQKQGMQAEQLRIVQGRWPGKKAVRLNQGHLAAEQFDVTGKAFTVEAWFRKNGAGVWCGNNDLQNGTLFSIGSGYWDGWRLTTACKDQTVGFEI